LGEREKRMGGEGEKVGSDEVVDRFVRLITPFVLKQDLELDAD
jgi:hypothetical protein